MTNYWYVARSNELFIDTDNVSKSIKHTRARLQGAIECGKLEVLEVMSMESSPNHLHTIITLKNDLSSVERFVWEIILHGDIYRGCCNIMRWLHGVPYPNVLISPHQDFLSHDKKWTRPADHVCQCVGKHKAAIMQTCQVAIRLRGRHRTAAFFGKPSKNPCKIWELPDL